MLGFSLGYQSLPRFDPSNPYSLAVLEYPKEKDLVRQYEEHEGPTSININSKFVKKLSNNCFPLF